MVEKKDEAAESSVTDNNYNALALNVEMYLKDEVFEGKFQLMLAKHMKEVGNRYFNLQDCDENELQVKSW